MNNADKPAYPVDPRSHQYLDDPRDDGRVYGLTKRERFAMAAMQGMINKEDAYRTESDDKIHVNIGIAEMAVAHADALLKALED